MEGPSSCRAASLTPWNLRTNSVIIWAWSSAQNAPATPTSSGKLIVDLSVGEAKDLAPPAEPATVAFARLGGLKGGVARAASLSDDERKRIAKNAAETRWEKVGGQLAKSVGVENSKLLLVTKLDPSKYADYCAASVALFQEITSLKQNEAGLLMRQILSGK
jgi:hypothetical protein